MQISNRLEAVAAMVTPGSTVADVGTDHGYIPIYLVKNETIPHGIAMDVNRGPLSKAVENIRAYGLSERIETRLSDGLTALMPGEAETIIIAGMGGPLTVRILTEGQDKLSKSRELILQPQSDIRQVRAYLEKQGWQIEQEEMIREEGKYYPMMRAVRSGEEKAAMTELELRYGPLLLASCNPILRDFLLHEQIVNGRILDSLKGQKGDSASARRKEVEQELALVEEALTLFRYG